VLLLESLDGFPRFVWCEVVSLLRRDVAAAGTGLLRRLWVWAL
jgi:hypothetical protein